MSGLIPQEATVINVQVGEFNVHIDFYVRTRTEEDLLDIEEIVGDLEMLIDRDVSITYACLDEFERTTLAPAKNTFCVFLRNPRRL